jgi:hypothetical protein
MRPYILCFALALAACTQWSKPGATDQDRQADDAACQNEATAKAPPQLGPSPTPDTAQIAPAYSCVAGRSCVPTGMSTAPTAPDVIDVNADARARLFDQCMRNRGWTK